MANPLAVAFVQIRPMSGPAFGRELKSQLDTQAATAGKSGEKAGESFAAGLKGKLTKVSGLITAGLAGGAVAAGAASVDMAVKFQTGMNKLVTSAGETQKNLGVVSDGIKKIAAPDQGGGLAYLRVADDIAARIASGELAPGTRLRPERELAEFYGVAYGTVRRAMAVLRERGVIETIHGRGTFVRE